MVNILVVDYSALMRRKMCGIINSDHDFHVADVSASGDDAYNKIMANDYDLIVMDMTMPSLHGIRLLKKLNAQGYRVPIIAIITDLKEDRDVMVRAMELGVYEFICRKGQINMDHGDFAQRLLEIMHKAAAAESRPVRRRTPSAGAEEAPLDFAESVAANASRTLEILDNIARRPSQGGRTRSADAPEKAAEVPTQRRTLKAAEPKPAEVPKAAEPKPAEVPKAVEPKPTEVPKAVEPKPIEPPKAQKPAGRAAGGKKLIALACSTGGPQALHVMVPMLPEDLSVPMVLVQHMPEGFTEALAERLDQSSKVHVKEAAEGDVLQPGWIYIAPGGKHMKICENQKNQAFVRISDDPPVNSLRPCADVMYDSLQNSSYDEIICVVLTGMGSDGTKGIAALKKHKRIYCISESEETCVVYGMPKSIANNHLSDEVVPINKVAEAIVKKLGG